MAVLLLSVHMTTLLEYPLGPEFGARRKPPVGGDGFLVYIYYPVSFMGSQVHRFMF